MKRLSVLIIEDDAATRSLLAAAMQEDGHISRLAASLEEAGQALAAERPDLIIMDRGLPDGDGLKLCIDLRKDARFRSVPLLMLTGKAETGQRVLGLRYGADDYLTKPFEMAELLARVDGLIRRIRPDLAGFSNTLSCGGVAMFIPGRQVTVGGKVVELGNVEYELLRVLLERPGEALSREFLLSAVWKGDSGGVGPKTVDVTIMSLRRKLGVFGGLITAVRGYGYMISPP
jgi:two-component system phosphate regulon response regulator PhoB